MPRVLHVRLPPHRFPIPIPAKQASSPSQMVEQQLNVVVHEDSDARDESHVDCTYALLLSDIMCHPECNMAGEDIDVVALGCRVLAWTQLCEVGPYGWV